MINIPMNTKPSMDLGIGTNGLGGNNGLSQQGLNYNGQMNNGFNQQPVMQQPVNNSFNQQPVNNAFVQQSVSQGQGVILKKGERTSLTKLNPNLDRVRVCLGWDVGNNTSYDLDASAFLLGANGKVVGDDWFVYYNQPMSPDGAVKSLGDSRNGAGDGDDEVISVNLNQLNPQVDKIVFVVTINEALERGHNFGQIKNAYLRVVDESNNRELVRFNLTEFYSTVTSLMVGELYKKGGEVRFNPLGEGKNAMGLLELCQFYGVNVAG